MPELNVSRTNISKLFVDMQNRKFIIPEYQRPYKWDEEKCEILWQDIINFHESQSRGPSDEYFLGTIVSYKTENSLIEIIDGQQRITSFMLLLRSFFRKLENMPEDANVKGLKNQIAPCIWDIDPISQVVSDKKKFHIESKVVIDDEKKVFHDILETGIFSEDSRDLYSKNYRFFLDKCEDYARDAPMQWQPLCVTILQKCIVLPIECDSQDTALTIFSTLNDRGMPLSDSDIFKAEIYKSKSDSHAKLQFTQDWKNLTSICKASSISLEDVFRFYSHVIRAKENDKTKEIALRKFYAKDQYIRLRSNSLLDDLYSLAEFWQYINVDKKPDNDDYVIDNKSKKLLHCLSLYPNEYWKYAISVFFLRKKDNNDFVSQLHSFLKRLLSFLFIKFIYKPTVNAIKDDIYQFCINIQKDGDALIAQTVNEHELKNRIKEFSTSKISRAIILLHAYIYPNQQDLIPRTFDVEHIFPQKWQNTNYNGWEDNSAQEHLEMFGNKVAIEKKLNIQAGNNYFGNKKRKYSTNSSIQEVVSLGNLQQQDWTKEDIDRRDAEFIIRVIEFFKSSLS